MQGAQENYNKNKRPDELRTLHENTIKQIRELQELERYMFANLQNINKSDAGASEQETRIRKRIEDLVVVRQNLFSKLKGMYTTTQINVTRSREDLADQLAVGKTMTDELTNTEEQLEVLRKEKLNKMKMVEIGQYEYERYNELRGIMKQVVYGVFVILIVSFLMRQIWFPRILGVALIAFTVAAVLINILGRIRTNMRRNDRDYGKVTQSYGGRFNKVIEPEAASIEEGSSKGLAGLLSCATGEGFGVMSNSKYSYLN